MKERIQIRPLRPDDLRSVYALGSEAFEGEPMAGIGAWNESNLADVLIRDPGFSLIAATKKKTAGFLIASPDKGGDPSSVTIWWLCIHRSQAPGLLRDLLESFSSRCSEKNIATMSVILPDSNSEIIQFFQNFGFTESKRFITMENFLPK